MSKNKIVISEFMDEQALSQLQSLFDVVYDPSLVNDPVRLGQQLEQAHVLVVRNRTQVSQPVIDAAPWLQVIGRLGVGLDNIDLQACQKRDIAVYPATGANSRAVAEYVIGAMLLLMRRCFFATQEVASGLWPRNAYSNGKEIAGKTLGLVGFGGIGRLVAQLAQSLGLTVLAYDAALKETSPIWQETGVVACSLSELLQQSHVLSLHLPLNDSTRGLFSKERIAQMRPGSVLINTSRGGIVDEQALIDALHQGQLLGAALDVFSDEPLSARPEWENTPGLILTPHVAGVTTESNEKVSHLIASRIIEHFSLDTNTP